MVKSRLQPHHAPTAAWAEEQRINRLQLVVEFATDKNCGLDRFDKLIEFELGGTAVRIGPLADDVERFRSRLESTLVAIASGDRRVKLPSDEFPPLHVSADHDGLHYSAEDPKTETSEDLHGMARRWRVVERALDGLTRRLRICGWCRKLYLRRHRSDYCDLRHSAAAARSRRKQRLAEKEAKKGVQDL
jgi:hypothetical protein